jgi:hypothetical protein
LRGFTTEEVDWLYEQKISAWRIREYVGRAKEGVLTLKADMEYEMKMSV